MIVDTSLAHWDWKWVHVAAYLDMCNVFSVPISENLLNDDENYNKETPLLVAIKVNKIDVVKNILMRKPDLTLVDINADSCLHLAALGSTNLLRLVLKECHHYHGLSLIEKVNRLGHTPFHLACYNDKTANVNEFLKIGLSIRLLTLGKCDNQQTGESSQQKTDSDWSLTNEQSKSEIIVIFTSDMLNNLDVEESKNGGSPLHWCKKRKLMSLLIEYGFNLDVVNLLDETPLFSMIRKQRLDCMLPLLNAGASVDIYGTNGQTPLNFAIEKGFRDCFQALIVFDCDFNFPNKQKVTPRHTASQNTLPVHPYMLHVLDKLGASRCTMSLKECKDGCAFNGSFNGQPDSDQTTTRNKYFYFDTTTNVSNSDQAANSGTQRVSKKVNMLCIDGGGMKGLFGIQSLIEIQKLLNKPLIDYFDWIGATSTGAIIASSLIIGKSLKQLRADYFELKDEIFNNKRPHNTEALERILKRYVGSDRKISSIAWKKLMITSILADRDPPRLHLFRTYKPSIDLNEPFTIEGETSKSSDDLNLWEAIRASSAAPVFFKPYGPFIDGGLLSNNPTLDCLTEFFNNEPTNLDNLSDDDSYSDKSDAGEMIPQKETLNLVLSIGNGKPHPTPVVNFDYGNMAFRRNPVGVFRSAFKYITLGELMVKLATHPDNHVVQRSRAWCKSLNISYYRLSPPLREKLLNKIKAISS